MNNKKRCEELKQIRKEIAEQNGIELHQQQCKYQGECTGTCPKCQQEEQILNRSLIQKVAMGTMVGASSLALLSGCTSPFSEPLAGATTALEEPTPTELLVGEFDDSVEPTEEPEPTFELSGDVEIYIPEETPTIEPELEIMGDMVYIPTMECEIMEVNEKFLIVSPKEGSIERNSSDLFEIPNINNDEFQVGDNVLITYNGDILETYPAQLSEVIEIRAIINE